MTTIEFTVVFHSWFRVGSAYARDGVDAALDRDDPLPADHLKGVMRAAARDLLGLPSPLVGGVFGESRTPSPWAWSSATPTGGPWTISRRHRVGIDPDTHAARKDALVLAEQAWTPEATFSVTHTGPKSTVDSRHLLVLRASAAAMHGVGAWRRRGLGWVSVSTSDGPLSAEAAALLLEWRRSA